VIDGKVAWYVNGVLDVEPPKDIIAKTFRTKGIWLPVEALREMVSGKMRFYESIIENDCPCEICMTKRYKRRIEKIKKAFPPEVAEALLGDER